ncbi:MAG: hypothetical protein [Caudoviricetes sp.]|nr:MAG: hypothetical protein [Caudoviricetes sp.]
MVDSILATNSPNGSVGVYSWVRNAESERYSPGIITGFVGKGSGMSYQPAASPYNVCLAANASGDRDIFALNAADNNAKLPLTAPTTQGQGRCYAIVAYRLAAEKATQNNGVGTVHFAAVAGGDSVIAAENPPTDTAIRNAITGGATAYICVVAIVTVYYGQTSITAPYINTRLPHTTVPINGSTIPGYQLRSIPTTHPVVLDQGRQTSETTWNWAKWSDGRVDMSAEMMISGRYTFDTGGPWHRVSLRVDNLYPVPLIAGLHGAKASRTVVHIGASNNFQCLAYLNQPVPLDRFGVVTLYDPYGGTIENPVFSLSVKGFWF